MIHKELNNQDQRINEFSLPKNFTIHRILMFLKGSLVEFEREFKVLSMEIKLEDDITKELCLYFQSKAKDEDLLFDFNPRIGVDIGILVSPLKLGTKPIFTIEAKRLSKNHYDYVKGNTGGIERFKREQDGFGEHLSQSAMIGYIQEESSKYWEDKINNWINELIENETDIVWGKTDLLVPDVENCDFISSHQRITKPPIKLFHFWISLN